MGIGASFFYGKGKDSGDAGVQFVDSRPPGQNPKDAVDLPQPVQGQTDPSDAKALEEMTPRERVAALAKNSTVTFVTRDKDSAPYASNYSPSPIRSSQTSPSSFKISSETVLAYPSPTRLHSPLVSYTNDVNQVSPILKPVRNTSRHSLSRDSTPAEDIMSRKKRRWADLFYCSMPSPSWKPVREADEDERSPSLSPDHQWPSPSSHWNHLDTGGRPFRKGEQMYYHDEDGQFTMRSPKERRYF